MQPPTSRLDTKPHLLTIQFYRARQSLDLSCSLRQVSWYQVPRLIHIERCQRLLGVVELLIQVRASNLGYRLDRVIEVVDRRQDKIPGMVEKSQEAQAGAPMMMQ